jgi:hypothetical protein
MEKRKIIIKEIENWRRSKVLPEHYCDFLMNLYQDDEVKTTSWNTVSKTSIRNSHWKLWLLIGVILTAVCVIVFNFNLFPIPMQIGISTFFILLCYLLGILKLHKNKSISYMFLGTASIFLLFIGQHLMKLHGVEDALWVLGYLVLCSIIWIVIGIILKLGLFQFCGWTGLIMFYGWILHSRIDEIHWFQIQMFWIPLTVIFIWLGWLLHHRNKSLGNVYFLVGIFLWFVPDVYLIMMTESTDQWMQVSFIGKIGIAGILLFVLRKKWTEWVA